MNKLFIFLIAYIVSAFIFGFGRISKGLLKDSIQGLGILLTLVTAISSFFFLTLKDAFIAIPTCILLIMPISGFLTAWLKSILFKEEIGIRFFNLTGLSENELERPKNEQTGTKKAYLFGGKRKGINEGKPYYGQGAKLLEDTKDGWKIIISPIQSEFLQEPKEVDEKQFISMMLNLGVPKVKLYEFINYEIDWENF